MSWNNKENLHSCYKRILSAFMKSVPFVVAPATINQIDTYCRTCALYLWHKAGRDAAECTNDLNCIYSTEKLQTQYSTDQIAHAFSLLSKRDYVPSIPGFFTDLIKEDVHNRSSYSRKLLECLTLVFLAFATTTEPLDEKKSQSIQEIRNSLAQACDTANVIPYNAPFALRDFIPKKKTQSLLNVSVTNTGNNTPDIKDHISQASVKTPEKKEHRKSALAELNQLVGLKTAKKEIQELYDFAQIQQYRKQQGLPCSDISYHLVFLGNPGTGKTTVARLVGQIYKEIGVVNIGHTVEVSAKDLIAGYVGQTAIKTAEVIEKAQGGILFIDEAYTLLDRNNQGYGQEAIDTLLKEMEDKRDRFAVIAAGYETLMDQFINSNPGLKSRFNRYIHFDDYSTDELMTIFKSFCKKGAYVLDEEAIPAIAEYFENASADRSSFANARTVRNYYEKTISKQASRVSLIKDKTPDVLSLIKYEDVIWWKDEISDKEDSLEKALEDLNALVGLSTVKEEISDLILMVKHQQLRKAQGLKNPSLSLHLSFVGNPGTGKTTVARLIARIYKCLGLLSKGILVETDRSGLVAGYVGQTAIKTQSVISSALGGVLFVDEAYALASGGPNDYGQEAIDTLLKAMEDNRNDFVVIIAGYEDLMDHFIHSNPGLESRFNRYIHFSDYSVNEMISIFKSFCSTNQYSLSENAEQELTNYFIKNTSASIGNGRGVRNLFEKVITQQAKRIAGSNDIAPEEISIITGQDIQAASNKR